jgi:hypothetical protein
MSSEISTDAVRLKPDTTPAGDRHGRAQQDSSLQPWQFFLLAALGCATAVTFLARSQGVTTVILLTVMMGAAAIVGLAALRAVRPLVSAHDDRSAVVGQRTRAALEQEKTLALRTIKDLEFDHAMGKISEDDFHEMSVRLRSRATRLIKQLDAGSGYRSQIERDLAKRLGETGEKGGAVHTCARCSVANDADARFCKSCGAALSTTA